MILCFNAYLNVLFNEILIDFSFAMCFFCLIKKFICF